MYLLFLFNQGSPVKLGACLCESQVSAHNRLDNYLMVCRLTLQLIYIQYIEYIDIFYHSETRLFKKPSSQCRNVIGKPEGIGARRASQVQELL